jgi:hypothetical protein
VDKFIEDIDNSYQNIMRMVKWISLVFTIQRMPNRFI